MTIDQATLASRLKSARIVANLTQDEVASALDIPRTSVVQLEAGNRAVSTLELARLAELYGRSIASFFEADTESDEGGMLVALLRASGSPEGQGPWKQEITKYLNIFRAGVELERLLERPSHGGPPMYSLPRPQRVMDAVDQGVSVAEQERRRLELGQAPVADVADLINGQGIWASGASLPDEMSGLFLHSSSIGFGILVQRSNSDLRKRFSLAHEYAHALLDRDQQTSFTFERNRNELTEVRANAFAAAFLMPQSGVRQFLAARSKGGRSVMEQTVYDPGVEDRGDAVSAHRRTTAAVQEITYEDVAALADHFGVSYVAALYRLKALHLVSKDEFAGLQEKEEIGRQYLRLLQEFGAGYHDSEGQTEKPDREIAAQVVHLAIEAYRRDLITRAKLRDVGALLRVDPVQLLELAEGA